jgi:aspartokinase
MKWLVAIAVACGLGLGGLWLARSRPHAAAPVVAASTPKAPRAAASVDTAAIRDYRERERFGQDVEDFFVRAPRLDPATRQRQADALREELRRRETDRSISAGESMNLQIALVRATVDDPQAQASALAALAEHFRTDAEQANQAWQQHLATDPQFQRYKQDERRIVETVMAMPVIPGGVSRDAYLREQLQHAREMAYRQ